MSQSISNKKTDSDVDDTPDSSNNSITVHPTLSSTDLDSFLNTLGICGIVGYEAEINHTIGLCKLARQEYNLLMICSSTNTYTYKIKKKHRILYTCIAANAEWFKILFNIGNKNDLISLRSKNDETLYHLLCGSDYIYNYAVPNPEWSITCFESRLHHIQKRITIFNLLEPTKLAIGAQTTRGDTCLCIASYFNDAADMVRTILKFQNKNNRININHQNIYRQSALLLACMNQKEPTIIGLLASMEDIDLNIQDHYGYTPLMYTIHSMNFRPNPISRKYVPLVFRTTGEYLINNYGNKLNYNLQNEEGNTVLHHAIGHRNYAVVKLLCTLPQIDMTIRNNTGKIPLLFSVFLGNYISLRELLKYKSRYDINSVDDDGNNAMHLLLSNEGYVPNIAKMLHRHNVDINLLNHDGDNPFDVARKHRNHRLARDLLQYFSKK